MCFLTAFCFAYKSVNQDCLERIVELEFLLKRWEAAFQYGGELDCWMRLWFFMFIFFKLLKTLLSIKNKKLEGCCVLNKAS